MSGTGPVAPAARTLLARLLAALALLVLVAAAPVSAQDKPAPATTATADDLSFGLVADVQYADKPDAGARRYSSSIERLAAAAEDWSDEDLAFVVELGDLIDGRDTPEGGEADLDRVLAGFRASGAPLRPVIGNHGLTIGRASLQGRLGLGRSWYSFERDGWRFLVVDSLWLGTAGRDDADPLAGDARAWLAAHGAVAPAEDGSGGRPAAPNAHEWNGGLGPAQRAWLADQLAAAAAAGEHAVVLSHLPVLAASASAATVLWDADDVLAILQRSPAFVAWIAGHDHAGGYAEVGGRHFLTLEGMVEAPPGGNAYAVVHVRPDALEVDGRGIVADRVLAAPAADAPLPVLLPPPTEQSVPARTEYLGRTIARTMHWTGAEWLLRPSRAKEEATARMLQALRVVAGSTVADFGCGNGYHTLNLAKLVGPEGHVLGIDIQPEMLAMLGQRAKAAGLANVEPVLATELDPGLAPASVDLVLMADVYHELDRPELVLRSVRRALRAEGRLALLEFRAEDPDVPIKPEHEMSTDQILSELVANGFVPVETVETLPWQHLVLFRARW